MSFHLARACAMSSASSLRRNALASYPTRASSFGVSINLRWFFGSSPRSQLHLRALCLRFEQNPLRHSSVKIAPPHRDLLSSRLTATRPHALLLALALASTPAWPPTPIPTLALALSPTVTPHSYPLPPTLTPHPNPLPNPFPLTLDSQCGATWPTAGHRWSSFRPRQGREWRVHQVLTTLTHLPIATMPSIALYLPFFP